MLSSLQIIVHWYSRCLLMKWWSSTSIANNRRSNDHFGCTLQFRVWSGQQDVWMPVQFCFVAEERKQFYTSLVLSFLTRQPSILHGAEPGPWRVALERRGLIHYSNYFLQEASQLNQTTAGMLLTCPQNSVEFSSPLPLNRGSTLLSMCIFVFPSKWCSLVIISLLLLSCFPHSLSPLRFHIF